MKTHLKIKICSLAAEAVIIRRNENKWKERTVFHDNVKQPHPLYFDLHRHRVHEVRPEARAAQIAYGYLRGRSYKSIEAKCHEPPNWMRVFLLVAKFGPPADKKEVVEKVKAWAALS